MKDFKPPEGFDFSKGDSIHTSEDPKPHLTGSMNGETVHVPFSGQTTLGMFDRECGTHRLGDVEKLASENPSVFRDSGLGWDKMH